MNMKKGLRWTPLVLALMSAFAHASTADRVSTVTYNAKGLVETTDGPRTDVSDITHYAYDAQGRLATVTDALGHVTTYDTYDPYGNPGRAVDANGVVTSMTYTPEGWLSTTTRDATGTPSTTTVTYDAVGNVIQSQDGDGVVLKYTFDDASRLTDITDGVGNRIHYTLDAAGNRTKEETFDAGNTLKRSVSRTFNSLSQLLTVVDALNRTVLSFDTTDGYDAEGHPIHSADAKGVQRKQGYDALNRLVSTIDDYNGTNTATANTQTASTFDSSDNLEAVSDPSSLNTVYDHNGLGDLTGIHSPDTGTTTFTVDAAGNRLTQTDARGVLTTYTYDALNRRLSASYSDASLNVAYYYDEANATTGCVASAPIGRLTRVVENAVTTTYCYDARGNVVQKKQTQVAATDTLGYSYTLADRVATETRPSGTVVRYGHDALGLVNGVWVTPAGGIEQAVASTITWLPFGPVLSYTLGNGQTVTRTYDANYAVTDIVSPALELHFSRDAMGNITGVSEAGGGSVSYGYDPLYRLTSVNDATGTAIEAYTYNQTGDRTGKTGPGLATGAYGYQSATHWLTNVGTASRAYDANGNTTGSAFAGNAWGYGYDGRNRLTVVQQNGATVARYGYNAEGLRVTKTLSPTGNAPLRFAYDEDNGLVGEYGTSSRDYVALGSLSLGVLDSSSSGAALRYVYADGFGAPRAVSDQAGAVLWKWGFASNPFGETDPVSTSGFTLNLRFPGQYRDAESSLTYNGYRFYDATTGRFIQSDPIGLGGGPSTYGYVGGNPLIASDALGLACPPQLKANGTCIDASNYSEKVSDHQTVQGSVETDEVAATNGWKLDSSGNEEAYGAISPMDVFSVRPGTGVRTPRGYVGSFSVPTDTVAVCHSHPHGSGFTPTPGFGDDDQIRNSGRPNYIVRNGVIGAVEKVDGQYQYRIITGTLSRQERDATRKQLNSYQRN
jgi:RHS repeat-associated protein